MAKLEKTIKTHRTFIYKHNNVNFPIKFTLNLDNLNGLISFVALLDEARKDVMDTIYQIQEKRKSNNLAG